MVCSTLKSFVLILKCIKLIVSMFLHKNKSFSKSVLTEITTEF